MAIYHLHCDIIGRSGGRSATAAAAYRATCKIEDRTTGEIFDFSKKEKALFTAIYHTADCPEWASNRAELWNSCEEKENRKNSQFCRSFDIALMKEFSLEKNIELVKNWVAQNYVLRGLVADVAIHAPHKNRDGTTNENYHAHILIPTRKLNKEGWTTKDREGNDKEFLKQVRTSWADIVNAEFERQGMAERIDERTLEEQGIDREPQQHQGAKATAMERKGKNPDRKKYRSNETAQEEITVSDDEVSKALENDFEYWNLIAEKNKIVEKQNSPEAKAQRKFEIAQKQILAKAQTPKRAREGVKVFVEANQREELFYYVKHNTQDELNFWQEKINNASDDWRNRPYIDGMKDRQKAVKTIANYPQFDKEIYPTVDSYYKDSFGFSADTGGKHFNKFKHWVETTDLLPVKVCRIAIQKLREWRDENFPKQQQSQNKGWSMSD